MPRMPHRRTDERSAHELVSVDAAMNLWERDAVDWPVSGDETMRYLGPLQRGLERREVPFRRAG